MPDWITATQAAELSGYHPDYIRKLAQAGAIKAQKWGQEWQISRKSLLAYLGAMETRGKRRGPKTKKSGDPAL